MNARRSFSICCSESSGYISSVDTTKVGLAAGSLGAGRAKKSDVIDPSVGFVLKKRVGDAVTKGESLATLYINDEKKGQTAASILLDSYQISDTQPEAIPLIYDIEK